jgi:hypothetical protein
MINAVKLFKESVEHHIEHVMHGYGGKLKAYPPFVLYLVYLISWSVLIQGIADIALKIMGYTPWLVKFPWRIDFLFLTALSVLMGYQTLVGIKKRDLDVTRNSVQIGILVETALVMGDAFFLLGPGKEVEGAFWIRLPFMIFTTINVIILLYLTKRLDLLKDEHGARRWF